MVSGWCVGHGCVVDTPKFLNLVLKNGRIFVNDDPQVALVISCPSSEVPKGMDDNRLCESCARKNMAQNGIKPSGNTTTQNNTRMGESSDESEDDEVDSMSKLSLSEGETIGRYRLGKKLGQGSYGTVFMCYNAAGEPFAVKVINRDLLGKTQAQIQLRREIDTMKMLSHENIVTFIEEFEDNAHIYVVLEYASKGDAFDLLVKYARGVPEEIAAKLFHQVFSAVDYIHSKNIVHRDIKPENFFLDSRGNIKLGDFGFANYTSKAGRKSILQTPCGSAQYVAPEIVNKMPQTNMVDVWSLGISLYTMVTGQDPWNKKGKPLSLVEQYHLILRGEYNRIPDTVSQECVDLIKKMLRVNPAERITLKDAMNHPWFKKFGI